MATTNYVWDPLNDSYLMETDENGATIAVYTQESVQYGGLISRNLDTANSYFHQDNLGSTRSVTDETGFATDTFTYDAWGNEVDRTGSTEVSFRWVGGHGYIWNPEEKTYYVRARVYSPVHSCWSSKDLKGFIDGINLYNLYHPLNSIDPSGTKCEFKVCSSPVAAGLGGHLFIIVNGMVLRAGPSRAGLGSSSGKDYGNEKCPCYNKGLGQLVGDAGPWDETAPDHPNNPDEGRGYPEEKLKCAKTEYEGDCRELELCCGRVLVALKDCCIPYAATPVSGKIDGNSNSVVMWMLSICLPSEKPKEYVPDDARVNPGLNQFIPDCIKKRQYK